MKLEEAQTRRMTLFQKWNIKVAHDTKKKEVNKTLDSMRLSVLEGAAIVAQITTEDGSVIDIY